MCELKWWHSIPHPSLKLNLSDWLTQWWRPFEVLVSFTRMSIESIHWISPRMEKHWSAVVMMIPLSSMIVKRERRSTNHRLVLWTFSRSRAKKNLNSKKYGVDLIHFSHTTDNVIHSSTKIDGKSLLGFSLQRKRDLLDTIRFLSLHDNKYIRYFPGHVKKWGMKGVKIFSKCSSRVISLSMSPVDDLFLSTSLDSTLRIWDLKSTTCAVSSRRPFFLQMSNLVFSQGLMHLNGRPVANFDPEVRRWWSVQMYVTFSFSRVLSLLLASLLKRLNYTIFDRSTK